jgi:RNA polymerase sigma-70 factor (ECF subfamily)
MSVMGPEELGRLVSDHAAALVLYARQWCAAPEDVVQEAFIKLVSQTRPPAQVVPWLFRVVRNGAISAARSQRRRRHHEGVAATKMPPLFQPEEGRALDAEAAAAALQQLPADEREVIVAHLWGGLTFEEIAAIAGCSASTAHRWYLAGLSALRERLGAPCRTTSIKPN